MRDKNSPPYTIFRQRVGYLRAKMIANKLTPTEIKPQIPASNIESEDANCKKRKRKSRWTNDSVQVPLVSPVGVIPPVAIGQNIPQPMNAQQIGNFIS